MQPAPELEDLLRAYYAASAQGDSAFLRRHLARAPGTVVVGTAAEEWWQGGEHVIATWSEAWERRGGLPVHGSQPRAQRSGDLGWAADQAFWTLPDGRVTPFRVTVVFERGAEGWQIVQAHFSVAVPNARLGDEL